MREIGFRDNISVENLRILDLLWGTAETLLWPVVIKYEQMVTILYILVQPAKIPKLL